MRANNLGVRKWVIAATIILASEVHSSAQVVDTIPPKVVLIGDDALTICKGDDYTDQGFEVEDDAYYTGHSDFIIETEGTFKEESTCTAGLYSFRYKVIDPSGNIGYSNKRIILVIADQYPCEHTGYHCDKTSLKEHRSLSPTINIYPNPSTGKVSLQLEPAFDGQQPNITVTTLLGEEITIVNGQFMTHQYIIDLSSQPSGVYLVKVAGDGYSAVRRVVIER